MATITIENIAPDNSRKRIIISGEPDDIEKVWKSVNPPIHIGCKNNQGEIITTEHESLNDDYHLKAYGDDGKTEIEIGNKNTKKDINITIPEVVRQTAKV